MNITEALARAIQEPTLLKAMSWICLWESERVVKQARAYPTWDTCFEHCLKLVIEAWHTEAGVCVCETLRSRVPTYDERLVPFIPRLGLQGIDLVCRDCGRLGPGSFSHVNWRNDKAWTRGRMEGGEP